MISVIIPIYNVEKYLQNCLTSLKMQSFKDWEAILVDDGSTDNSSAICDEYCLKDKRFHVIHKQNKGIAAARNDGMDLAKREFVYFMDSDDYIHPRTLEVQIRALTENECADFSMVYGKKSYIHNESFGEISSEVIHLGQEDLLRGLFGTSEQEIQYQAIWNKLFRRSLIEDLRFKDIVAEDVEFMMRVYLRTNKVALIPHEMYYYYQRSDSITHQDTNNNNQIVRERFIHNLDTYYQIYTYIPKSEKQYQAMSLWKLYKRIFNVRYYAYSTPFKNVAKSTIYEVKNKTWHDAMANPCMETSKKWIIRLLYHFPVMYRLMMWRNRRRGEVYNGVWINRKNYLMSLHSFASR